VTAGTVAKQTDCLGTHALLVMAKFKEDRENYVNVLHCLVRIYVMCIASFQTVSLLHRENSPEIFKFETNGKKLTPKKKYFSLRKNSETIYKFENHERP